MKLTYELQVYQKAEKAIDAFLENRTLYHKDIPEIDEIDPGMQFMLANAIYPEFEGAKLVITKLPRTDSEKFGRYQIEVTDGINDNLSIDLINNFSTLIGPEESRLYKALFIVNPATGKPYQ